MPTDRTLRPSITLTRVAPQLDGIVQKALTQEPFDDVGVTLALTMLRSSIDDLESALYLSECLTKRLPAELALARTG